MAKSVDTRGLSCPQPVIVTKQAIQHGDFPIEVLADTATARDNISRVAAKFGCKVTIMAQDNEFKLTLTK